MRNKIIPLLLLLALLVTILPAPVEASITDGLADLATNAPYAPIAGFYSRLTATDLFYGIAQSKNTMSYNPSTNTWANLTSIPDGTQWFFVTESNNTVGEAYVVGYTGSAVKVYAWHFLANSWTSYTITGLVGSNMLIFADAGGNTLHVITDLGVDPHDWTHSISTTTGAWTDNGHIAAIDTADFSYKYQAFYKSPKWYFLNDGIGKTGFTYDTTTDTYAQLLETNKDTIPAVNTYFGNIFWDGGAYAYGLDSKSATTLSNANNPEMWRYTLATDTWAKYADYTGDSWDFGVNIRGDTVFRNVMAFRADNNVMYYVSSRSSSYTTIKTLRLYGFATSSQPPVFRPPGTKGTPTTTGTMTDVTWDIPRATFNDELQGWYWHGTANLIFKPQVIDSFGNVLVGPVDMQLDDTGYWDWGSISLPTNFTGFFKAVDTVSGLSSTWGYATYARVSGFASTKTYAKYLDSASYRNPANYVAGPSDMNIWAWHTDIAETDMADYEFRIMQYSSTDDNTYIGVLGTLNTGYFQVGNPDNYHLTAVRYILTMLDMPAGTNDYDDLIANLGRNYSVSPSYEGFYEPAITDSATGLTRLTTTQSVYWYTKNPAPFSITMDKMSYTPSSPASAGIQVFSTVLYNPFDTLKWQIITTAGALVSGPTTVTDRLLTDVVSSFVPANAGTYYADAYLYNSGDSGIFNPHAYYQFIVGGKASGPGGGQPTNPIDKIKEWLDQWGLNNMMGTWGLTIIVMFIVWLIFKITVPGKIGDLMAATFALMVLGLAIVSGFVDPWIIILLALGAGFTIFAIFFRNRGGQVEG